MTHLIDVPTVLSIVSFVFTIYFWMVKANREAPKLDFYQLNDFMAIVRTKRDCDEVKRLCLSHRDQGGVLIMNQSARQNSIVLFDCYLLTEEGEVQGDWGYSGEDKPPWNIGPDSTIAFSPACFFDVPNDYEVPEDLTFRIEFITASGKRFQHTFQQYAPRLKKENPIVSKAA